MLHGAGLCGPLCAVSQETPLPLCPVGVVMCGHALLGPCIELNFCALQHRRQEAVRHQQPVQPVGQTGKLWPACK